MKIEIYFPKDFDSETRQQMWDQGISMDDWDYLIVTVPGQLDELPENLFGYWNVVEYYYGVLLFGNKCDIGVVYH